MSFKAGLHFLDKSNTTCRYRSLKPYRPNRNLVNTLRRLVVRISKVFIYSIVYWLYINITAHHSLCSDEVIPVTFTLLRSILPTCELILSFLISNFLFVLNVECFLLGNSPASEFYVPKFRNTLSVSSS